MFDDYAGQICHLFLSVLLIVASLESIRFQVCYRQKNRMPRFYHHLSCISYSALLFML
jgi:hypothetical protein